MTTANSQSVSYEIVGETGLIALNNPPVNAASFHLRQGLEAAVQALHVLAGSSFNLGANDLGKRSRRLERLARHGGLDECCGQVEDLEREWRRLSRELEHALARRRPAELEVVSAG